MTRAAKKDKNKEFNPTETLIDIYRGHCNEEKEFDDSDFKDDLIELSKEHQSPIYISNLRTIVCLYCFNKIFKINKYMVGVEADKHLIGVFISDNPITMDWAIEYLTKGEFPQLSTLEYNLFESYSLTTDSELIFKEAHYLYFGGNMELMSK